MRTDPIILFNGASDNMDAWDPSFLTGLSSNHTVIAFDQRGIANTTIGSKPDTYQQIADDAAGLLDALKIKSRCYGIFSWIIFSATAYNDVSR